MSFVRLLLRLLEIACVTGWRRLRGLPLAPVDSVASRVAPLSGQNLASVRDQYKREATSEYSSGFDSFPSGMSTHSYATRWSARFGLASPAADQRPAAAQRGAPPNSDGSEGSDPTAQSSRATANEFEKLKTSPHVATLLKLAEHAEESIPVLASDSDPEVVRSWIDLVGTTCEEKVGALALLRKICRRSSAGSTCSRSSDGWRGPKVFQRTTLLPCV